MRRPKNKYDFRELAAFLAAANAPSWNTIQPQQNTISATRGRVQGDNWIHDMTTRRLRFRLPRILRWAIAGCRTASRQSQTLQSEKPWNRL